MGVISLSILNEDRKSELIAKSKKSEKGRQRYARRRLSSVSKSNREYNRLNTDKFFKEDIIDIGIVVHGETDTYIVSISFGGVLDKLNRILQGREQIQLGDISRALIQAFNSDNVYIRCSCPDATFRMNYWQSKNDIITGPKETRPSDITNPHDTLGSACKHVLLVLSNASWLIKVASVIKNYIEYMSKHQKRLYADIIYPAIYKKPYEESGGGTWNKIRLKKQIQTQLLHHYLLVLSLV